MLEKAIDRKLSMRHWSAIVAAVVSFWLLRARRSLWLLAKAAAPKTRQMTMATMTSAKLKPVIDWVLAVWKRIRMKFLGPYKSNKYAGFCKSARAGLLE